MPSEKPNQLIRTLYNHMLKNKTSRSRCPITWCLFVSLGLFLGCSSGGPQGAIDGKVSFDGESIQEGVISFLPTNGTTGPASGGIIADGKYSISAEQGPVIGNHQVKILANRKTGKKIAPPPPATGTVDEVEQYIPEKYNTQSTLTIEIKAGKNTKDFDLKSK